MRAQIEDRTPDKSAFGGALRWRIIEAVMAMDKKQARRFRERWLAVERIRRRELRGASLELRWRRINAAYGLARALPAAAAPTGETRVRERWAKLKNRLPRP